MDVWIDTFVSDRSRLGQILLNLLGNAIKFTPAGSVVLAVTQQQARDGRCLLRFAVTDTGIGIAPSSQEALFQRFHQVDPSMQRRYGGAGLGLAISKQLVERLGGRIGVESAPGCGSTFWFEIEGATGVQDALAAEPTASSEPAREAGSARVLVVEDVVLNRELARELLETAGYTVDVVANGRDAVAAAGLGVYDAILMDSLDARDGWRDRDPTISVRPRLGYAARPSSPARPMSCQLKSCRCTRRVSTPICASRCAVPNFTRS